MKKQRLNESITGDILTGIVKHPEAALAAAQVAIFAGAAALNGVQKLQGKIWKHGWLPIYTRMLKKQYGQEFMKMVHDLSSSKAFKKALNDRAYTYSHIDRTIKAGNIPKEQEAERKRKVDGLILAQTRKIIEDEFPEHLSTLESGVKDTQKNILSFVDKEYDFRYDPQEPGAGDPEFATRQVKRAKRRTDMRKYKDALRKAKIKNPKTGNTILLRTVLTGKNYDPEFVQQAKDMAANLRTKYQL